MGRKKKQTGLNLAFERIRKEKRLQFIIVVALLIVSSVWAYSLSTRTANSSCEGDSCLLPLSGNKTVLAEVNGEKIYESEFNKEFDMLLFMNGLPESYASHIKKDVLLNQSIMQKVLYEEALKSGYSVSRSDAEAALKGPLGGTESALNQLKESIENRSFDYAFFLDYFKKGLIINNFINATVLSQVTVSDDEARAYYDANKDRFHTNEKVRASHILVNTSEEAERLIAKLDLGANFSELAKNYSIGPSSVNGGDLGYFERGQMVPEFENAVFALEKIGDYTEEPVKTDYGYHIIMLTGRKEPHNLTFEEVSDELKNQILSQKQSLALSQYVNTLMSRQNITIYLRSEESTGTGIQKTNKPSVELFVMAYCPYGTQIEKGLLPVIKILGGKIDFRVKFCDYAMHGKKELDEEIRQHCIQEEQNDTYIDYLTCFLAEGDYEACLDDAEINRSILADCMNETDNKFSVSDNYNDQSTWKGSYPTFRVYQEDVDKYNVRGSPTLVINGAVVQSARDSKSLLSTICSAFVSPPSECAESMSSATPSPGFGFDSTGGSSGGGCGA